MRERILFISGKWTEKELDQFILESSKIGDAGNRIDVLSREFLGTAYQEYTLPGDRNTPEVFVVNLGGVDCFTFIDYVEAMRISGSFSDFVANLQKIRYGGGRISFEDRNHFFTDWMESNAAFVKDATPEIGESAAVTVQKVLNKKGDGTSWIAGIRPARREIKYIPSPAVDDKVLNGLRTGDYAGIYSEAPGLDVSHVGIIIITGKGKAYLRHASSRHRKVVDEDLINYISGKPGLILLRPIALMRKVSGGRGQA
ncbi:MAG: N-acetylmuramoyl-L-alanine amidase-like domain-containing protein [Thermodesulfovibrionales bacterium]